MQKTILLSLLIILILLAGPLSSRAEEEVVTDVKKKQESTKAEKKTVADKNKQHLDEMVVTATRTEKNMDLAPASTSIITSKKINLLTFGNLDQTIKYEVGVYEGKLKKLSNETQTLVMLNGMPLNNGWRDLPRWDNIAMENVERIEIVRDPGSALYGGNAMGGTINIITSMPDDLEVGANGKIDNDDNVRYGDFIGDRLFDRLSVRFGFQIDQELMGYPTGYVQRTLKNEPGDATGGFFMKTATDKDAWIVGNYNNLHESDWNIDFAAEYDFEKLEILQFDSQIGAHEYYYDAPHSYLKNEDGNPVYSGTVNTKNGRYTTVSWDNYLNGKGNLENGAYMLTYTNDFGPVDFVGKFDYQHKNQWYTDADPQNGQTYYNAEGMIRKFDSNIYFTDLQTSFDVGFHNRITANVYGRMNTFEQGQWNLSYYRDEHSIISGKTQMTEGKDQYFTIYIQDEWEAIEKKLTFYGGARFDYWRAFDGKSGATNNVLKLGNSNNSTVSPKIATVWTPFRETVIRGSIDKAFHPPTLYDLYQTYSSGSEMVYSNPDLKPKNLWNYEIGATQYAYNRMFKFGLSLFYMDINNLIYYYNEGDDKYKDNAEKARIQGLEFSASAIPWEWLTVWFNYTYNDTEITEQSKDPDMEGKKITGTPEQIINAGADFRYGWFKAGLSGQYLGRIYNNKYNTNIPDVYKGDSETWVWQGKIAAMIPIKSQYIKSVEVSFAVTNLFDETYYEYAIGRERSYFVELKLF